MVPGTSGDQGVLLDSILGAGALISGGYVKRSILSSRVRVLDSASVEDSILFDQVTVGEGATLRRCIIDKGVSIPPGMQIGVNLEVDRERYTVSDNGVIVVPRLHCFS